jgi:hypothetical protein
MAPNNGSVPPWAEREERTKLQENDPEVKRDPKQTRENEARIVVNVQQDVENIINF